jgi:HSP20 family protein
MDVYLRRKERVMTLVIDRRPESFLGRFADWFDPSDMWNWIDRGKVGEFIRVEETVADGKVVIKAELPGIDPDKDVDITVGDGLLSITARRSAEESGESEGKRFSEFQYGSFHRTLSLPKDAKTTDVAAEYKDGILTITVPRPAQTVVEPTKVPVMRS